MKGEMLKGFGSFCVDLSNTESQTRMLASRLVRDERSGQFR